MSAAPDDGEQCWVSPNPSFCSCLFKPPCTFSTGPIRVPCRNSAELQQSLPAWMFSLVCFMAFLY